MKNSWMLLAVLMSFNVMAEVSQESKLSKIEEIQALEAAGVGVNIESFLRDLKYEEQGLSIEERTQHEMNILFDKVKQQVAFSYQEKLSANDDSDAVYQEVKVSIEADSELADPAYREEIKRVALEALEAIHSGGISSEPTSSSIEPIIQQNLEERIKYLKLPDDGVNAQNPAGAQYNNPFPSSSRAKDAEKLVYANKSEVMQSLASSGENTRWVSSASANYDLGSTWTAESSVKIQLKCKFLGTGISAGPTIAFARKFGANAMLMFEGMEYPINNDGTFNRWKKNNAGQIIMKNGQRERRFMAFYCIVWQQADSKYEGEATVSVDVGFASQTASVSLSNFEQSSSSLTSRRIMVPESIGNQIVNVNMIRQICWKDFLKANIRQGLTVQQSLNVMMYNMLSNLVFSHPKSKCATDAHCLPWARNMNMTASTKARVYPRCMEDSKEKFRFCELKSLEGSSCEMFQYGKRITMETFFKQNACDHGLKCTITNPVIYVPGTRWIFQSAIAVCKPENPRTYRRPVLR
jgi:hypothetical protein